MVLEILDTTYTVGEVNNADTPKVDDALSPLSICTQPAIPPKPDAREDTALSAPCDSITDYANELAASNSEPEAAAAGEGGVVPLEDAPEQRDQPQEVAAIDSVEIVASNEEPTLQVATKDDAKPAEVVDTEEVVQEQMETIDLVTPKAADNKEHACSDFIVEQNDTMQVKEAEMSDALQLETTTSKNLTNDEESLVEVQVGKSQITELVSKTPEEKAAEIAEAAAQVAPNAEEPSDSDNFNMIETFYSKVEGCLGDVTYMCGPRSNSDKEDKKDKEEDPFASFLPKELMATERVTSFVDEIINNESFKSERVTSFVDEIINNESLKSLTGNITDGISRATDAATDTIFPPPAPETDSPPQGEEKDDSTPPVNSNINSAEENKTPVDSNAEERETGETVTTNKSIPTPVKSKKRFTRIKKIFGKKKSSTVKKTVTPAAEEPSPVVQEAKETTEIEQKEVVEKEETVIPAAEEPSPVVEDVKEVEEKEVVEKEETVTPATEEPSPVVEDVKEVEQKEIVEKEETVTPAAEEPSPVVEDVKEVEQKEVVEKEETVIPAAEDPSPVDEDVKEVEEKEVVEKEETVIPAAEEPSPVVEDVKEVEEKEVVEKEETATPATEEPSPVVEDVKEVEQKEIVEKEETVTPAAEEPSPVAEETKEVEEKEIVEKEDTFPADEAKDDANVNSAWRQLQSHIHETPSNSKPKLRRLLFARSTKSILSPIKILSPKLPQLKRGLSKSKVTASKAASKFKSATNVKKVAQTCMDKTNKKKSIKSLVSSKKDAVVEEPEADLSSKESVEVVLSPEADLSSVESVEVVVLDEAQESVEAVVEEAQENSTVDSASPKAESNTDVPPAEEQQTSEASEDEPEVAVPEASEEEPKAEE